MRIYSVHIRRGGLDPERDIVLVREGFSWPAALFAPFWALWCGLWIPAIALVLAIGGLMAISGALGASGVFTGIVLAGVAAVTGYIANDLYRANLERRGFVFQDIVAAQDRDSAEHRFFDRNPSLAAGIAT